MSDSTSDREKRGRDTVERMIQSGKDFAEKQGNSRVTEAEVRKHVTGIAEQTDRKLKEKK